MGLSIYNIKKWYKMLLGKSLMHVNQDIGKSFMPGEIKGYFNNLTEKVTKDKDTLKNKKIPMSTDEIAGDVYFPIAIFQYGLGAYDLFLQTNENIYDFQFWNCTNWALDNQKSNGSWDNFGFIYPDAPYSSMCQGEGASLLLRAYVESKNDKYLIAAKKAINFMLIPIDEGGTARYENGRLVLYEYTNKTCVLNGWIFSIFGLYEICQIFEDRKYKEALKNTIDTLEMMLPNFDNGYWSMYDLSENISSPFYHNLHIAQLEALEMTFGNPIFKQYRIKFSKYGNDKINKKRAFFKKVVQKIKEK